jgi:TolA-binding protein
MLVNITGRVRNYIFLGFVTITIVSLFMAKSVADQRNISLVKDYMSYQQAMKSVQQNNFKQAEPLLKDLLTKYPDSYRILGAYGKCLANSGKLSEGAEYMRKAREIFPALMKDPGYLAEYGTTLYMLGDYSKAEQYFEESKKMIKDPDRAREFDQYLTQVRKQKG